MARSTSTSGLVSVAGRFADGEGACTYDVIRSWVTAGESVASPAYAARTAATIPAGGVSLSRKPLVMGGLIEKHRDTAEALYRIADS